MLRKLRHKQKIYFLYKNACTHIKGYFIAKNSFVAEETFKEIKRLSSSKRRCVISTQVSMM